MTEIGQNNSFFYGDIYYCNNYYNIIMYIILWLFHYYIMFIASYIIFVGQVGTALQNGPSVLATPVCSVMD